MNARYLCWFVMVSAVLSRPVFSQGFVNLNFESANLSGYAPGTVEVPITNALPGWSASYISTQYGSNSSSVVGYDIISIGGTAISVNDTNRLLFVPFRGRYSAWLFGSGMGSSGGPFAISTEISQTGLVPSGTQP